ncbi:MAG: band 7 protein [Cyanobacteria bacterium RYN_339]|nr:band 7 protein [Cyanobacteria bacterium RYN_339]
MNKKSNAPAAEAFKQALMDIGQAHLVAEELEAEPAPEADAYVWDEAPNDRGGAPPMPAMAPPPAAMPLVGGPPGGGGFDAPLMQRAQGALRERSDAPARKKAAAPMSSYAAANKTSEELQLESSGMRVVETGFWIWRNVIVPPNAYVVHTRRGRAEPVTLGLGKSFRYNPLTDSYIAVPAAMQTIGIFAKCISAEKQGIHVLAYVQWLISDFAIAYKRLDFSNANDPMGIVNSQLREQAEAAIKDTVSTMTVEQVLTDKAPIIQELTERMKSVAEGRDGDGLGLKIVTVQIKEAVVASSSLFENLQTPYRNEKARVARLSTIATEAEIQAKGREAEVQREAADARATAEITRLRAETELSSAEANLAARTRQEELSQKAEQSEQQYRHQTELARLAADRETEERRQQAELARLADAYAHATREATFQAEQQLAGRKAEEQLAVARAESEIHELAAQQRAAEARRAAERVELDGRIALDRTRLAAKLQAEREAEVQRLDMAEAAHRVNNVADRANAEVERWRQETANAKSPMAIQTELIMRLPEIASQMPDIQEYRYVGVSDGKSGDGPFNALPEFLAKTLGVANAFGLRLPGSEPKPPEAP